MTSRNKSLSQAVSDHLPAPSLDHFNEGGAAMPALPTLQRNALRKIFERPDFTPEEVLALGYRRLQRAEGIGPKGMLFIEAWLAAHGLKLNPPEAPAHPPSDVPESIRKNINSAVRLLRTYGYRVQRIRDKTKPD